MALKLEVTNVSKRYVSKSKDRTIQALSDITFAVEEGKILGIVGESGCGKSTLSRIIAGLESPDTGTVQVTVKPHPVISKYVLKNRQRTVQLVFQDPYSSLNPRQPIYKAIDEVVAIYQPALTGSERDERVSDLLGRVGISRDMSNRYAHQFSGGQRQRICIARSLAANPEILLLDEPVSALDVSVRADIINLLLELKSQFNLTYIFVSHDLEIVKHVSDDIMVMNAGKIVEKGSWKEVMENPQDQYTKTLIEAMPKLSRRE